MSRQREAARDNAARRSGRAAWEFFESYTRDLNSRNFTQLFTLEAPEAYRFFARAIDEQSLAALPWHRRITTRCRQFFVAFTSRLAPARRALYGIGLLLPLVGLLLPIVTRSREDGIIWLVGGFAVMNLLVLLEVADRLTLKRDLEVAREIQMLMLPREMVTGGGLEAYGFTRPANTVGGDFYDVLPMPDGRLMLALGDVAGKGSPAALLMALVLAILRTLVDEGLMPEAIAHRLNLQVARHAPRSRFVTLCLVMFDPATGDIRYVNAGHPPPLLRRAGGQYDRLTAGGPALGMFELSTYAAGETTLGMGDVLVFYSDGITEAEDAAGAPFDEKGLEATIGQHWWKDAAGLGKAIVGAVEHHAIDTRLADDLTVLAVRRPIPLPVTS
jgi:sigma-B regulation protein RsbU (phosphoserine phosphatase)